MTFEIQVLDLDKHTYVAGLYRWMTAYLSCYIQTTRNLADSLPFKKPTCGQKKYHNKNIDSTIAESMTAKEIIA